MLTEQQRLAIEAATKVLQMAGITAWFEARIIKDSDKKLNGRRASSKRRTDLDTVLNVAESKRVGMLPDMRMELRMYATVTSSRSVVMGVETVPPGDQLMAGALQRMGQPTGNDTPRFTGNHLEGRANYSPAKNVERLRAEGLAENDPLMQKAKRKTRTYTVELPPNKITGSSIINMVTLPLGHAIDHTCNASGPMRQRESGGPFYTTCSLCGEINDT